MKEPLLISACLCGKNVRYDQKTNGILFWNDFRKLTD